MGSAGYAAAPSSHEATISNTWTNGQQAAAGAAQPMGSGMVLRWKRSDSVPAAAAQAEVARAQFSADSAFASGRSASTSQGGNAVRAVSHSGNPLRSEVHAAAYQQPVGDAFSNPFGDQPAPRLVQEVLPELPNANSPAQPGSGFPGLPNDPLSQPELAPPPGSGLTPPPSPFRDNQSREEASPLDRARGLFQEPESVPRREPESQELELPQRRTGDASSFTCEEIREYIKSRPISILSLDVSPKFGEGLRSVGKDNEEERQAFADTAPVRDWSDYTGRHLATGRLADLHNNMVVIDVNGSMQNVPYMDLSDVDVAYISQAWNIPGTCGTGYERFVGRNFVHSQVQHTASGLCHKPLYFEEVQLERYGHEVGPILQPLISSAHFFGNIAVLPYKMGIHPPNECQYSLGYIRPGNCAPYMLPPIPLSLRGAAVQAGVVTGAAALIP